MADKWALIVCDIQEAFRGKATGWDSLIDTAKATIRSYVALDFPIIVSEQYPRGLGSTIPELLEVIPDSAFKYDKVLFSCVTDSLKKHLASEPMRDIKNIAIVGVETHVCVDQTVCDLCALGYTVKVLADGVSSIHAHDRDSALRRFAAQGVGVETFESHVFKALASARHPAFRAVSAIVKEPRAPPQ